MMDSKQLKTADVRWDLSIFYQGLDDPRLDADIKKLTGMMKEFHDAYKGNLAAKLGDAISAYAEIEMLSTKFGYFLFLSNTLDTGDSAIKAKLAETQRITSEADGQYMTFFTLEIAALSEKDLERAMKHPVAEKHRSWIEQVRIRKPFMLSEPVESALTKRSSFGSGAWAEFFDELESDLEFTWKGEKKNLPGIMHVLSESKDPEERVEALKTISAGLGGMFAKYSAETLYMVVGSSAVERKERGYKHPMQGRNLSNRIPDSVVEALHCAVRDVAAPLAQRFYRLKAAHLGLRKLRWSDRNAPMPFSDTSVTTFDKALDIVLEAYESFSPTLAKLVRESAAEKRMDVPALKGKRGGGFNASGVLPGNIPFEMTMLNYLGSMRDVMVLAHEAGHGVHALVAAPTQGPLMFHAPMAYCETASVFGEMVTFESLKKKLAKEGNTEALLALLMGKIDDMVNTTVRQIGFSNFERRFHGMDATYSEWHEPKKLSPQELNELFKTTLQELYGKDGDVFTYEDTDYLWSYVGHFHRPFYVYAYSFGEFFVQSLYAKRKEFGEKFEPLYLDMLRSGGTKDAVELMKPFGLDPTSETFWEDGINVGLGALIEEAEALSRKMGVKF